MPLRYISLFTGIGVGELAISRIFPDAICLGYSEIDADANQIYKHHYKNHLNLGDVCEIDGTQFAGQVDLIIGGSPCQAFSRKGKQAGFTDPRSRLFYHYKRILTETKARWFIFENVNSMKPEIRKTITQELGVQPVIIDACLFTPQVRRRAFWTNFPVPQPEKQHNLQLRDILLPTTNMKDLSTNSVRGTTLQSLIQNGRERDVFAITLVGAYSQGVKGRTDGKANTVTAILNELQIVYDGTKFRRLDCVEAERLQGLPDDYTSMLPRVRRYKCIGNAFCLPVIVYLCEHLANAYYR